jgi:hypothetical protein
MVPHKYIILQYKQIGLIFVIILVYYMHFSDLKWNSYELSKIWLFSGIFNSTQKLLIPRGYLAYQADWWGCGQVRCHAGINQVKPWLGAGVPRRRVNGRRWRRSRHPWTRVQHKKEPAGTGKPFCGSAPNIRSPEWAPTSSSVVAPSGRTTISRYRSIQAIIRSSGDSHAHQEARGRLGADKHCWSWMKSKDFWWTPMKGNG